MPKLISKNPPSGKSRPRSVTYTVSISRTISDATTQYKQDMGLTSEQDVMRLALATFLKREGYAIN